jgi:hypothetical protein
MQQRYTDNLKEQTETVEAEGWNKWNKKCRRRPHQ